MTEQRTARDALDRLCSTYRNKPPTTQRERAEREREIWVAAKPVITLPERAEGAAVWFRRRFGGVIMTYQHRSSLLSAGAASDPLWEAIANSELTLPEAGQLLREAKSIGDTPNELFLSVQMVLEERLGKPLTQRTPPASLPATPLPSPPVKPAVKPAVKPETSAKLRAAAKLGVEARRQKYGTAQPSRKAATKPASNGEKPPLKPERAVRDRAEDISRDFRTKMRDATIVSLRDFFARRTETMDEYLVNRAQAAFGEWVETGVSNFLYDIQRARREGEHSKLARIGQVRFSQACDLLGIFKVAGQRVVFGKPLDDKGYKELFSLARERHHQRSLPLHPDRIHGREPTPAERAEYQAVQDARIVIEDYIRQMTESKGSAP